MIGAAAVSVAALMWWWPSIFPPADAEIDVSIISDDFLVGFTRPVSDRVHESGRTTSWIEGVDVCEFSTDATSSNADVIVVTGAGLNSCPAVLSDLADHAGRVIVIAQPGRTDINALPAGLTVVDPERLIGPAGAGLTLPCQWWEEDACSDGFVAVRNADGSLTREASDRIARMVVAELP